MVRDSGTRWLYQKLEEAVADVNKQYRFDIELIEEVQLACYRVGHFYDWHMDIGKGSLSTRKLSMSVQLSDPLTYDGGELEIQFHDEKRIDIKVEILRCERTLHSQEKVYSGYVEKGITTERIAKEQAYLLSHFPDYCRLISE